MKRTYKKGFALTGTVAIITVALTALLGTGAYLTDKSLNSRQNFDKISVNKKQKHGQNKDHDFIPNYNILNGTKSGNLSDIEKQGLLSMREEEKLARDVYRTLYDKWGVQIFQNISYSENRHSLAVKALLNRYNIPDPVKDNSTGAFTDQTMQGLYNSLVLKGSTSLNDALQVGATIEDLDIKDLHNWIANTDNEDIKMIYENLMRGSRNHMRSFVGQIKSHGNSYTAQYLPQDEIDNIVASEKERGNHGENKGQDNEMHKRGNGSGQQRQHKGTGGHRGQGRMHREGRGR